METVSEDTQKAYEQETNPTLRPEVETRKNIKTLSRKITLPSGLIRKGTGFLKEIFYQSTISEKVIVGSCIIAIFASVLPWATLQNITITGTNNFLYPIGFLVIASSAAGILSVLWNILGKSKPKFIPRISQFYILLGIELIQLGLITYVALEAYRTKLFATGTAINTVNIGLIIGAGLLILSVALFDSRKKEKAKASKILPQESFQESVTPHEDLQSILETRDQDLESQQIQPQVTE